MHERPNLIAVLATVFAFLALGLLHSCGGGSDSSSSVASTSASVDVLTWHNDIARSGQYLHESALTPTTVDSGQFGLRALWPVDGRVQAQPLYASKVTAADGVAHNLLLIATSHDSVYAFDADVGTILWKTSLLAAGEVPSDDRGCWDETPEIGVIATPVIDRSQPGPGVVYVVGFSKDGSGQYFQRLHALSLSTGSELPNSPVAVQASYPGNGDGNASGQVVFDPGQYSERAALLLVNGVVVTTWASHCDIRPYTGWIISYDAATLAQRNVLNITPNGTGGASWGSGAGPAADPSGNIYFMAGNGTFDSTMDPSGRPDQGNYGNAFLKLGLGPNLVVADYFSTFDTVAQSSIDSDLGSGGAIVLPDMTDTTGNVRHLALGAGKDRKIYVVDRDAMGGFDPASNRIYQEVTGALGGGIFGGPVHFQGRVYYGAVRDSIKAFAWNNARLSSTPQSQTSNTFVFPGAIPSISANGHSGAIVWAVENTTPAVLHAYDATDLSIELYNSQQAGSRDEFGAGNKFVTPTVAAGKVFVGTPNAVAVFGKL